MESYSKTPFLEDYSVAINNRRIIFVTIHPKPFAEDNYVEDFAQTNSLTSYM